MKKQQKYFNKNNKELHISETSQGILITLKHQEPNTASQIMLVTDKEFNDLLKDGWIKQN